jgi:glutamine synthetase
VLTRVIDTADERAGIGFAVGVEIEFCLVRAEGGAHPPVDTSLFAGTTTLNDREDFVCDVCASLERQRIGVEMLHAESAPGQMELVLPYDHDVMQLADDVVLAKETIRACAKRHNMRALFLPKVYEGHAGNGMHIHLSLRDTKADEPLRNTFSGTTSPFSISSVGQSFIEGILVHLSALLGITMPTPNSFSRVGKGCWTGHTIGWQVEDKESPLRVCLDAGQHAATNVELKLIDNSCNIYLALASVLWAGLDGIVRDRQLRPEMAAEKETRCLPKSLGASLDCLEMSALFEKLLGNLLTSYVAVKRAEIRHGDDTGPGLEKYLTQELTK